MALPKSKKAFKNKWGFPKNSDGNHIKFKASIIVKGFDQEKGIHFDEKFYLVVKDVASFIVI